MLMSWIWAIISAISLCSAFLTGNGSALAGAVVQGAGAGVNLAITMAGSLCLWSGVGAVMEAAGITDMLSRLFRPLLHRVFPSTKKDAALSRDLSGNICANFLGLGNAATPLGIRAAQQLKRGDTATDELCRLIVLNTASIQLIPTTVASVRAAAGSSAPFDILPAVWLASALSVGVGIAACKLLARIWRD